MKDQVKGNQRTTQKLPVSNSVKKAIKSGADKVQTAAKEAVEHKSGSSALTRFALSRGPKKAVTFDEKKESV